jgi:hypothetical protein
LTPSRPCHPIISSDPSRHASLRLDNSDNKLDGATNAAVLDPAKLHLDSDSEHESVWSEAQHYSDGEGQWRHGKFTPYVPESSNGDDSDYEDSNQAEDAKSDEHPVCSDNTDTKIGKQDKMPALRWAGEGTHEPSSVGTQGCRDSSNSSSSNSNTAAAATPAAATPRSEAPGTALGDTDMTAR